MPYLYKRIKTKHKDFITKTKCFYYNPQAAQRKRGIRLYSTGESKERRNKHNAYRKRMYLMYNNFDIGDMFVTLTYRQECCPTDPNEAHKLLMKELGKIRKKLARKNIPFVYFVKTEAGGRTRVHHHLIIRNNFEVASVLYEYWKRYGKVKDFQEIYNFQNGRLVKYILDGAGHKELDFEKYSHSRNLKEPEVETKIMPYSSFRENPKPPKPRDGIKYVVENVFNGFMNSDGYIYQEYELLKIRE